MLQALVVGSIGSSALVLGGVAGSVWDAPSEVTGVLLAFASGTLIAALAFELFPEAVDVGGLGPSAVGVFTGAAVFVTGNTVVDSRVAAGAGDSRQRPGTGTDFGGSRRCRSRPARQVVDGRRPAFSCARRCRLRVACRRDAGRRPGELGVGVSLAGTDEGVSGVVALLVAILVSNFSESLVGAVAMRSGLRSRQFVIGIWALAAVVLTMAVVVGRVVADTMSPGTLAFALSFAGGAVWRRSPTP